MEFFAFLLLFSLWILLLVKLRSDSRRLDQISRRLDHLERKLNPEASREQPSDKTSALPSTPPPIPTQFTTPKPRPLRSINWERFMGVNLFAWIGGFALFLAAGFFLKYSIENEWISAEIRVALGFVVSIAALFTGMFLHRKGYEVSAQSLWATGIVILYVDIFACYSFYHFISLLPAFAIMSVVTAAAFLFAIRFNARVVAILGLLGGFLTPGLLSSAENNPLALFSYCAFLDIGLMAIALHRRWNFLILLAAFGTIATEFGWTNQFFVIPELNVAIAVFSTFEILFLAAFSICHVRKQLSASVVAAAVLIPLGALAFAGYVLTSAESGHAALRLFSHVFIADLSLIAIPLITQRHEWIQRTAAMFVFLLLAFWTSLYLTPFLTDTALLLYGTFAALNCFLPCIRGTRQFEAVLLPFVLLSLVILCLQFNDPNPLFRMGFVFTIVFLAIAGFRNAMWIIPLSFIGAIAFQYIWVVERFDSRYALADLLWHFLFYLAFFLYPFLLRNRFETNRTPWIVAAVSGPLQFYLIHHSFAVLYGKSFIGLLPVLMAIPSITAFYIRKENSSNAAWFAGSALFFLTLIFPVQFQREWVTIGWALEGAALLWLFRRFGHSGLRFLGATLLVVSFLRLTLNPAVFSYHHRSGVPIWNWYLYAYGIVTAAIVAGAKFLSGQQEKTQTINARWLLYALAVILAFVLLNIEIADYFAEGDVLTFQFSGDFARDMSYSICWAGYALLILIIGIRKKVAGARYASIGLIGLTLLKLFFHDLANLYQLYRVGALVGVAVILILASYLYQRFVSFEPKKS